MIERIVDMLDKNIDRLVGDMDIHTALETIERLQELRDMEGYHDLKFGKWMCKIAQTHVYEWAIKRRK